MPRWKSFGSVGRNGDDGVGDAVVKATDDGLRLALVIATLIAAWAGEGKESPCHTVFLGAGTGDVFELVKVNGADAGVHGKVTLSAKR